MRPSGAVCCLPQYFCDELLQRIPCAYFRICLLCRQNWHQKDHSGTTEFVLRLAGGELGGVPPWSRAVQGSAAPTATVLLAIFGF